VDNEQTQLGATGGGVDTRFGDDQDLLRLVDTRDVILGAIQTVVGAVTHRRGLDVMRVRTGVGLGDGEGHLGAVGQTRQKLFPLFVGAVTCDDRRANRRRNKHQQQRTTGGRHLFAHGGELRDTEPRPAVFLRDVYPEKSVFRELRPQLGLPAVRFGLCLVVSVTVLSSDATYGVSQELSLRTLGKRLWWIGNATRKRRHDTTLSAGFELDAASSAQRLRNTRRITLFEAVRGSASNTTTRSTLNNGFTRSRTRRWSSDRSSPSFGSAAEGSRRAPDSDDARQV